MAYTRRYLLNRVKAVNEIYKRESKRGVTAIFIYENLIRDQFNISYSTFYNYLAIPYERQLRELDQKEAEAKRREPTLFEGEEVDEDKC